MKTEEKSPFPKSELGSSALFFSRCWPVAPGLPVQHYRFSHEQQHTGCYSQEGDHTSGERNHD